MNELICLIEAIISVLIVFYNMNKYKSEKVRWGIFSFVIVNLAIQISAFIVLPFDLMKVRASITRG